MKREAGARQGRTGAVRWHKKRRSGKRKKKSERDRRGEREEKKMVNGADESVGRGGKCGEKRLERKERERERETGREKERDARSGVEAAGFLSRHRRSHPTKIDSVSLGSSVQRRATRRTFRPSLLVRPGRERQRVSSVLVVLFLLPFTLSFCLSHSFSLSRSLFPEEPYSTVFSIADVPRGEAEAKSARERDC